MEKTGLRDLRPLAMHQKEFNKDFFCNDLDLIFIDNNAKPLAIIELKHSHIKEISLHTMQTKCQRYIADKLELPYFIIAYFPKGSEQDAREHWVFFVIPGNDRAKNELIKFRGTKSPLVLSQRDFYEFESSVRNVAPDASIIENLDPEVGKYYCPMVYF